MESDDLLVRHKGTRNVYLRIITSSKGEAVDITSSFQMTDENHIPKLLSTKNSIKDKLRKVRELDDKILIILELEDDEQKLKAVLSRDNCIQELIVKIERCMNKVPN